MRLEFRTVRNDFRNKLNMAVELEIFKNCGTQRKSPYYPASESRSQAGMRCTQQGDVILRIRKTRGADCGFIKGNWVDGYESLELEGIGLCDRLLTCGGIDKNTYERFDHN